jgi:hypothetical protein
MGGDAEYEELGIYRATLSETLAPDISVPTMPCGAPPAPDTSVANTTITTDHRRTIGTSKVSLLSFHLMFPSKPRIQNTGSGNGMPRNIAPHMYRVYEGRKDQGQSLLDGGSTPPPSDEDNPATTDTTAPAIGEDKGTCKAPGK